ncbi:MAG: recombinase family protein [Christensenellales bacterium]
MEMIKAAKRGEIDYIITKSIARFARNLVETLRIIRELRAINVGVYFEKENIDTLNTASDFMISLYSIIAESELTSMSENVKWAARKAIPKRQRGVKLKPIWLYSARWAANTRTLMKRK